MVLLAFDKDSLVMAVGGYSAPAGTHRSSLPGARWVSSNQPMSSAQIDSKQPSPLAAAIAGQSLAAEILHAGIRTTD